MGWNAVARVRLADVNKEKLYLVAVKLLCQRIDSGDRSRGHGASCRPEGQDNIFMTAKIAQPKVIALKRTQLKVRRSLSRARAPSEGAASHYVFRKNAASEVGIVISGI